MADYTTEIAALRTMINTGAESVTVDGQTYKISIRDARRRLRELIADDDTETPKRPRASSIDLSGF